MVGFSVANRNSSQEEREREIAARGVGPEGNLPSVAAQDIPFNSFRVEGRLHRGKIE